MSQACLCGEIMNIDTTTTTVSGVQPLPAAAVGAPSARRILDIASKDVVIEKILSSCDSGNTAIVVSLAPRNFKRLVDADPDKGVDQLIKIEGSLVAPSERTVSLRPRELQLKINEMCDEFGIEHFSIFDQTRCQKFLEFYRSFSFCSVFRNSGFDETNLNGCSFNPWELFSQVCTPLNSSEGLKRLEKIDEVSRRLKGQLDAFEKLINEYDPITRDLIDLKARSFEVNAFFRKVNWLRKNDCISEELSRVANEAIERTATYTLKYSSLHDFFTNEDNSDLCLEPKIRDRLTELFSQQVSGFPRAIALFLADLGVGNRDYSLGQTVQCAFSDFKELKRRLVSRDDNIMNTDEEAKWIDAAKKASTWLHKARTAGIVYKQRR